MVEEAMPVDTYNLWVWVEGQIDVQDFQSKKCRKFIKNPDLSNGFLDTIKII